VSSAEGSDTWCATCELCLVAGAEEPAGIVMAVSVAYQLSNVQQCMSVLCQYLE